MSQYNSGTKLSCPTLAVLPYSCDTTFRVMITDQYYDHDLYAYLPSSYNVSFTIQPSVHDPQHVPSSSRFP